MSLNPLLQLAALGQSVWLDDIGRGMLEDGSLARLIRQDGVSGMTTNPAIFGKAIEGREYDSAIASRRRSGLDDAALYEALVLEDVGRAAELFLPVFARSAGRDGFVSIEVSPHLAFDAVGTVAQAKRLWSALGRPNVMIKVPATHPGLTAVAQLTADGINVNATLLFGVDRYRETAMAYLAGLEQRLRAGLPLEGIASVASFFLSRIDSWVDKRLEALAGAGDRDGLVLSGQAAAVCARLAYQACKELHDSERWRKLARHGARPQRLLWASTGTKNPAYADVKYVDAVIAPGTVNTMPLATLEAYRNHGCPAVRIEEDLQGARALPGILRRRGIDLEAVAEELERDGVRKFVEPYDATLESLARRAGSEQSS